jgi:hypothetical protein
MNNKFALSLGIGFLIFVSAFLAVPALAESAPPASPGLPDFAIANLSVKRATGANAGLYLFVTVENKGDAVTSPNYLSISITGLATIGLPDGYVLYLTNDKTADGYVYAKGYKKEFIGPRVDQAGVKQLTPTVTIDPGNYFTESDKSNDALTKTLSVADNSAANAASAKDGKAVFDSGKSLTAFLKILGVKKNAKAQTAAMKKYTEPLIKGSKIIASEKYAINNFIVYGSSGTKKLTQDQRAAAIKTFMTDYKKVPVSANDWQNVVFPLVSK